MLRRKPSNASEKEPGHKVSAGSARLPSAPAGVPAWPAAAEPGLPTGY